ncbi:DUF1565 domain-containing protein [bacterium]|nr:DUF1565 domain-containing protein [bacterium]
MHKQIIIVSLLFFFLITLPCFASDFYVAPTGSDENGSGSVSNPWKTITHALSKVEGSLQDPVIIHVAVGFYNTSSGELYPLKMKSNVSILGYEKRSTILDAKGSNSSVIICDNINNLSIENLTITGGEATLIGSDKFGGGIYCNSSSPVILDCSITYNKTANNPGYGGGLYLINSSPSIIDCEISYNTTPGVLGFGGGIHCISSSPEIINCFIKNNDSRKGGGISCYSSNPHITDCVIGSNFATQDGGGIYCINSSSPKIINCKIFDNNATYNGGGIHCQIDSSAAIMNCEIVSNYTSLTTGDGGGIYIWTSNPVISNCTIAKNEAGIGGGISSYSSGTQIKNSILWFNLGGSISGDASITYTDIEGVYSGYRNIDSNPFFVEGIGDAYFLSHIEAGQSVDSPCIDAGSDTAENLNLDNLTTRTDGIPDKGIVDLGYHNDIPSTPTPTPTNTPTEDHKPLLFNSRVIPESGFQYQSFEYLVSYQDLDGGFPPVSYVDINGKNKTMTLKYGNTYDGIYSVFVSGYELNVGKNEFYFLFQDDENNEIRHPISGTLQGPEVYPIPTHTPTPTITLAPTPTITPTPSSCLRLTSPQDFYNNTVLLSWTPIFGVDHYQLEYIINNQQHSIDIMENWIRIIADNKSIWQSFAGLGPIPYRVTAYNKDGYILEGPTSWGIIICNPSLKNSSLTEMMPLGADPGCLRISSPDSFYFNNILLSWTPIRGADRYLFEYKYDLKIYSVDLKEYWLRLIASDSTQWDTFKLIGNVEFRVTAVDSDEKVIDGPTDWSSFACY